MKKLLIIYPHFPPSSLTGVHRARLVCRHLGKYGWQPMVLTVHEKFYEEQPDWALVELVPHDLEVVKVNANNRFGPIGDIGIRGFKNLLSKSVEMIRNRKIDFVWIPIPSFYTSLLGRMILRKTGVKFGIDYIDPWVHNFPGSEKLFSKAWFSTQLSKILEPIAVSKASLITGVNEKYYLPVLMRNKLLEKGVKVGAFGYGFEKQDLEVALKNPPKKPIFFASKKVQLIYAGALLPNSIEILHQVFISISKNLSIFKNLEIHFIGTGVPGKKNDMIIIEPLARKYGLWQSVIFEYPNRQPYLDVLNYIANASGVCILGSTDEHYTPSKLYLALQCRKPAFALLHPASAAVDIIQQSGIGLVQKLDSDLQSLQYSLVERYQEFERFLDSFDENDISTTIIEPYTAEASAKTLAGLLDLSIK